MTRVMAAGTRRANPWSICTWSSIRSKTRSRSSNLAGALLLLCSLGVGTPQLPECHQMLTIMTAARGAGTEPRLPECHPDVNAHSCQPGEDGERCELYEKTPSKTEFVEWGEVDPLSDHQAEEGEEDGGIEGQLESGESLLSEMTESQVDHEEDQDGGHAD